MGTMFSSLQTLSGWSQQKQDKWCEAVRHIEFMMAAYRRQLKEGRRFLHEHPASAASWGLKKVQEMMEGEGVMATVADQCQYGLLAKGDNGDMVPAKKKTKFTTNSQAIAAELRHAKESINTSSC